VLSVVQLRSVKIPLIVGNWKMNRTPAEARILAEELARRLRDAVSVEIVVCPPFTDLTLVAVALRDSNILLGAQNMHYEKSGAYTGEISPVFLKELGCSYVILGHSERRQLFGETDDLVNRKLRAALQHGLSPIVCVGETSAVHEAGRTRDVIEAQFNGSIRPVLKDCGTLTIAYEPIWAIGTGNTARPEQAAELHGFIRGLVARAAGPEFAQGLRIIYGGSATPENIDRLMQESEIDGVLVGGASLNPDSFARICRFESIADSR
jgi:triosephosphate isomerase